MVYDDLVKRLRAVTDGSHEDKCDGCPYDEDYPCCVDCLDTMLKQAADAIEELSRQRDRAYTRLCEWCGVCPEGKRNAEDCEIAALNPEPPKEEE